MNDSSPVQLILLLVLSLGAGCFSDRNIREHNVATSSVPDAGGVDSNLVPLPCLLQQHLTARWRASTTRRGASARPSP